MSTTNEENAPPPAKPQAHVTFGYLFCLVCPNCKKDIVNPTVGEEMFTVADMEQLKGVTCNHCSVELGVPAIPDVTDARIIQAYYRPVSLKAADV